MSLKSKNLSVNHEDPPFLRKLKGGYNEDAEKKARQVARPVKKILDTEDDEPTYVDERGNAILSKAEAEKMLDKESQLADPSPSTKKTEVPAGDSAQIDDTGSKAVQQQESSKIGATGKRKVGKVVAEDEIEDIEIDSKPKLAKKKAVKKSKVKLSFDDE